MAERALFDGVRYVLADTLSKHQTEEPLWVSRSVALQHVQPEGLYSPDPTRLFSGVVVSCAGLTPHDQEMITAAVESLGGAVKQTLCEEVTHLVATSRDTPKVHALEGRPDIAIEVVAPHWVNDSFRLNRRLPLRDYVFDLRTPNALPVCLRASWDRPQERASSPSSSSVDEGAAVLAGKKVLFARDIHGGALEAHPELHSLRDRVEAAGGTCLDTVAEAADEAAVETAVAAADVVVARYRESREFGAAMRQDVTVGTLPWLVHILSKGRMVSPRDRLLYFPYPRRPVPGFDRLTVTLTNYSGAARSYLKELIAKMGGTFTPHMTPSHDVCVALELVGEKVNKAREWNIPVVNHLWLEQCFATWTNQTLAQTQFLTFPGAAQLKAVVGHASVPDAALQAYVRPASKAAAPAHSQATPEAEGGAPAGPPEAPAEARAEEAAADAHVAPAAPADAAEQDTPMSHISQPTHTDPMVDETVYIQGNRDAEPDMRAKEAANEPQATEPLRETKEAQDEQRASGEAQHDAQHDAQEPAPQEPQELEEPQEPHEVHEAHEAHEPVERQVAQSTDAAPHSNVPADGAADLATTNGHTVPAYPSETSGDAHSDDAANAPAPEATQAADAPHGSPAAPPVTSTTLSDDQLAEAELGVAPPPTKRKSGHDTPRTPLSARKRKREVCLATTSVELKPSTLAVLDALHVRRVDDVAEATHLVAKGLTRTEKMLCAIALGTVQVVSVDWLKEVVRRKQLVDTTPYALHDAEKEAKWSMRLSDALARSAAHPGALLHGHTFYVSRSVQPSRDVLQRVIEAAGGHVLPLSSATARSVAQVHHHVLGAREDRKALQTLRDQAAKHGTPDLRIWTPELILVGVLRQEMQWDDQCALPL
ncbi:regulator of Ty1 Transposition [Malassezia brasiliensis]|uniref:Regulator of Ty1 Transposition n=1 Tax=Malassezia brasiliensis TaxID=1821822 RepID=A0AAF0DWH9_9BASI|nr:regulator of Ty1 Transposition [Malassezia brasiliensis]